jgi:HEAT repeat protein
MPGPGPFRGLAPYDESSAALFFGRAAECQTLFQQVTREAARVTALTGVSGAGKTSLLRAGLMPTLAKHGVLGLYVGAYESLDQALWQAASRSQADPPGSGESSAEYLVRLARGSRAGTLLVLDHLESLEPGSPAMAALGAVLSPAASSAGPRLRFLLSVESRAFHQLDALYAATTVSPAAGGWMELPGLDQAQVTEILEQTALQTGTFFEAGLAAVMAADLCRGGVCLPVDLQLVARAAVDLRLTSIRRYERSGGAELLLPTLFERIITEAGGHAARRVLLDLASLGAGQASAEDLAARTHVPRAQLDQALGGFVARGLVARREDGRAERYGLAHPVLADRIRDFGAVEVARARDARRALRRRVLGGGRLSVRDLVAVNRHLGGALEPDEEAAVRRSVRRTVFQASVALLAAVGLVLAVFFDLRKSYSLGFDPPGNSPNAHVVVRLGRPSLSFLYFLPSSPRFGAILADTGFAATAMGQELSARVAAGRATGTLERDRHPRVPGWLQTVLDGLRPVPRGVAMVLLGDPAGVVSLNQAFGDPVSRREALEALAVIGSGAAGEDEILAAALADRSPEIRRRGVEVAAAIDRRQGKGAHATTLKSALGDRSFEVRGAVLRECATLDPGTAASILSVALADKDAAFRRLAEKAMLDLAERAPAAAADAVRLALRSPDALARRAALALLEQIAARAPGEASAALSQIVADEKAPEEARVAALAFLRKSGVAPAKLQPLLEKATSPEASPRLRAAALPLYVKLLDPAQAEEIAVTESKGPPASRAVGAAVWGALAAKQPDAATKALKSFVFDPSPEVRIEAARSFGYLKREGAGLISKALLDPNPEVQRAAIDSAVTLAPAQPYAVPELLGKAVMNVRPAARRWIIEGLGRIGQDRPAAVMAPLAKALKQGDGGTRAAPAGTLCGIARKSPAAAAPYLRLAAHDTDRDVRAAAASCLGSLTEGDPKGAARMAGDLAAADEAPVRAAAAASLGALAPRAREVALAPLVKLVQDSDRGVRLAAAEAIAAYGNAHAPLGKHADEVERALGGFMSQGDAEERQAALRAATRCALPALLRQAAGDSDEAIRLEAVRASANLKPPAIEVLQGAIEDRSLAVRTEAIRRLAGVSGGNAEQVLTIFEAMLRSGDPGTRRAGALALGDLAGATEAATRLLSAALRQRGEGVRAAAAEALGRIAERDPERTTPLLEQTLNDPAHDVRSAAIRGLGAVWARARNPADVGAVLEASETDGERRLVALEALVLQARGGDKKRAAIDTLTRIAGSGPPLARLAAQIGRAFLGTKPGEMEAFLDRLLGG